MIVQGYLKPTPLYGVYSLINSFRSDLADVLGRDIGANPSAPQFLCHVYKKIRNRIPIPSRPNCSTNRSNGDKIYL